MDESNELSCIDKIAFGSQKEAITAATVAHFQHGSSLKTYKCKVCKLWHLSSKYD